MYTASRDALVNVFDVESSEKAPAAHSVRHVQSLQGHVDWVNDVVALGDGLVATCSSDTTCRVWREDGTSVCLSGHSDYVTGLAPSSSPSTSAKYSTPTMPTSSAHSSSGLYSCALGGEVFGWDLESGSKILTFRDIEQSAYCIASVGHEHLMLIGLAGRSNNVVVADGRSGVVVGVLTGHDGTVRRVVAGSDGIVYSGGGDGLVKGWDLRTLRSQDGLPALSALSSPSSTTSARSSDGSLQTIRCHTDSVWCLQYDEKNGSLYSSGRDGCVYRTETRRAVAAEVTPVSRLVVDCGEAVTGMRVVEDDVWIGVEASSSVTRYRIDSGRGDSGDSASALSSGVATATIPGMTTIQKLAPLTDKIHFLAKDRQGNVMLWDVTQAKEVEDLGSVPDEKWGELRAKMFDPTQSALTWFQPESSLGVVAGRLSPESCFLCETYTRHLGHPDAPNDEKVNVAEMMLRTLFVNWKRGILSLRRSATGSLGNDPDASAPPSNPRTGVFSFADSKDTMVMVSGNHASLPWKKNCCDMDGSEDVPEWVAKCVLEGAYPVSKQLKMSFALLPKRNSGLPPMGQSSLTAPRVLEVEKMLDYVIKRLRSKGIECEKELVVYTKGDDMGGKIFTALPGQVILECDGHVVPSNFTMAAIRQWMWKKPENLRIEYSVCKGGEPVRLPSIKIPEQH